MRRDSPARDVPHRRRSSVSAATLRQGQVAAQTSRARPDEEALAQCAADAVVNVFGCVFVEVWALSDDGTTLTRPGGGHWMDPVFAQSLFEWKLVVDALTLDGEAEDCPPGVGLAGTLADDVGLASRAVHWRQIKRMMEDPFVQRQSSDRMARLYKLGIGIVAAVPFHVGDSKGLVLFYSRTDADWEKLHAEANEQYMLVSADLIGANYATRKAREMSAQLRKSRFRESVAKFKKEFRQRKKKRSLGSIVLYDDDHSLRLLMEETRISQDIRGDNLAEKIGRETIKHGREILKRVYNSCGKWGGANLHGPPRHSSTDCLFTFTGCFIAMLMILNIAKYFRDHGEFDFEPGWYASTLCIVHAMTPAPVGQPRQIFGAHVWNMLVGLACRQLVADGSPGARHGLPLMHVQALSVALGVSGQAFFGLMHPPASGLSVLFASNPRWTSRTIIPVMLVDATVVAVSMIFLNLSDKKQYPLFWIGLGWQGSGGTWGYLRSRARSATGALRNFRTYLTRSYRNAQRSNKSPTHHQLFPNEKSYNTMGP